MRTTTESSHTRPFELYFGQRNVNQTQPSGVEKKSFKKRANQTLPELQASTQEALSTIATPADHFKEEKYFSSKEVDIQALPIQNIDASMLPEAMQNTQVKLRLFINEVGRLVRVEPIKSQLYQDEILEAALSERLYNVAFTPAKRHGIDVKSYQEVAYDVSANIQVSHMNSAP